MNTFFKRVFFVVALATVIAPTIALAQKSAGGVTGDARLRPGTWNSQRTTQSRMRSEPQYRSTTPSERAPEVVAQAPTERRSYSYEPSQSTDAGTTDSHAVRKMWLRKQRRNRESSSYDRTVDRQTAKLLLRAFDERAFSNSKELCRTPDEVIELIAVATHEWHQG